MLKQRPLLTQSVTTAVGIERVFGSTSANGAKVLFATGDTMAQQLVEKNGWKKHDVARTGRMALYGGGKSYCHRDHTIGKYIDWVQLSLDQQLRPGSASFSAVYNSLADPTRRFWHVSVWIRRCLLVPTCSVSSHQWHSWKERILRKS